MQLRLRLQERGEGPEFHRGFGLEGRQLDPDTSLVELVEGEQAACHMGRDADQVVPTLTARVEGGMTLKPGVGDNGFAAHGMSQSEMGCDVGGKPTGRVAG